MSSIANLQTSIVNPKDGLLLVDKVAGITSHDAVEQVRRRTRIKKIGHTGTLDPMATGLLILCIGKATRVQSYLTKMKKTYEGTIQFGWATNTYDAQGVMVGDRKEVDLSLLALAEATEQFRGDIQQTPPAFSAKKVGGVRSYEMARRGETMVLEPKLVRVDEFRILEVRDSQADFRIICSAGTYVRSVAHDLGAVLGVGAHLCVLRRTAIGAFDVRTALPYDGLAQMQPADVLASPHFQTLGEADLPLERFMVDRTQEEKLLRGQTVIVKPHGDGALVGQLVSVIAVTGEMVAIAEVTEVLRADGGPVVLQPKVVLKE